MLGSTIFRAFSRDSRLQVFGTMRDARNVDYFAPNQREFLIPNVDVESESGLVTAFSIAKPDIVINCVGIVKQHPKATDPLISLQVNAVLPHRLARYCKIANAKLVHFSTDCVFSGKKGQYKEDDTPDAADLYGRSKLLGEVDYEHAITLRTSIIGHELVGNKSLIGWFLNQTDEVYGYRRAIFSGLPTIEVARVVREYVIPYSKISGIYHLSVDPISKYDLLNLVAKIYGKTIKIIPNDEVVIDRSLNSERFRVATGFVPRPWPELIHDMYREYMLAMQWRDSSSVQAG